jgi:hypothetical protein
VAIRIVRAAVLTSFLALVFMVLVVVGSAIASDDAAPPSGAVPQARSVPVQVRLVGDTTVLAAQTDTAQVSAQNTGPVVQKSGPAAAATARTIDIIVVAAFVGLGLFVWVRNGSVRKGH